MLSLFVGCGNAVKTDAEIETEIESEIESKVEIEVDIKNEESTYKEIIRDTREKGFNDYNFEPMEEIVNATIYEGKIQIGDVVVRQTELVQELFFDLENSEVEWNYEYEPNQLIVSKEGLKIDIRCNDSVVFSFEAKNFTDDTITLKDCVVRDVDIDSRMDTNIFYGNGYGIDGKNVPSYIEYMDMYEKIHYKPSEEQEENGDINTVWSYYCVDVKVPSQKVAFDYILGYPVLSNEAIFDSKTGECIKFSVARTSNLHVRKYNPEEESNDLVRVGLWTIDISTISEEYIGTYKGDKGSLLVLYDKGEFYLEEAGCIYTDDGRWSYEEGTLYLSNYYFAPTDTPETFVICKYDEDGNVIELEGMIKQNNSCEGIEQRWYTE